MQTFEEFINEHVEPFQLFEKKKVVRVRKGKKQTVYVAKPGYRMQDNKEVKMSTKEKLNRKWGQKIAQKKRNVKMKQIQKHKAKSDHVRRTLDLHIGRPRKSGK